MAEVFASPTMLGKRSHLATCEPSEAAPFSSSGCKRRRPFDAMPSPGSDSMRVAPSFDGFNQPFGQQNWAVRSPAQAGFVFGGAHGQPPHQHQHLAPAPVQQQQMVGGGGEGVLGKRQFMGTVAIPRGGHESHEAEDDGESAAAAEVRKLKAEFAAYVSKREGEVKVMVEQHAELSRAYNQSQVQMEQLRNENRILKKGIAVQAGRAEKYEEEIKALRNGSREALAYIERLQTANHALTLQLMQGKGSCHEFINHQGPPDVF